MPAAGGTGCRPSRVLTGVALVVGYGLLGACWLVWKTEGELQLRAGNLARMLGLATLGFMALVSLVMPFLLPAFRARWFGFPELLRALPVPVLVVVLAYRFIVALRPGRAGRVARHDHDMTSCGATGSPSGAPSGCSSWPTGLGFTMWPMIVPPRITIWDAAAPPSSQLFLLVGAAVLIPVILAYTAYVYWLFRGKVQAGQGYH